MGVVCFDSAIEVILYNDMDIACPLYGHRQHNVLLVYSTSIMFAWLIRQEH